MLDNHRAEPVNHPKQDRPNLIVKMASISKRTRACKRRNPLRSADNVQCSFRSSYFACAVNIVLPKSISTSRGASRPTFGRGVS